MGKKSMIDGNTAASHVAYAFSELAAIYPCKRPLQPLFSPRNRSHCPRLLSVIAVHVRHPILRLSETSFFLKIFSLTNKC